METSGEVDFDFQIEGVLKVHVKCRGEYENTDTSGGKKKCKSGM